MKYGWDPIGSSCSKPPSILIDSIRIEGKMDMLVNDTLRLKPHIFPVTASNKRLVWKSDSITVANVDSTGLVTATARGGECIINVATTDGSQIFKTCRISVKIPIKELKISQTGDIKDDMAKGDKIYLSAKIDPENATNDGIRWETTDSHIAVVDEHGVVSVIRDNGSCYIIATASSGIKDSFLVSPKPIAIPLKSVVLSSNQKTIKKGESFSITAKFSPENATGTKLDWYFYPSIVKLTEGKINSIGHGGHQTIWFDAIKEGRCKITARNADKKVSASIDVVVVGRDNNSEERIKKSPVAVAVINHDLGYASYSGSLKNGKPEKGGVLKFRDSELYQRNGKKIMLHNGDKLVISNYQEIVDENRIQIMGSLTSDGNQKTVTLIIPIK